MEQSVLFPFGLTERGDRFTKSVMSDAFGGGVRRAPAAVD